MRFWIKNEANEALGEIEADSEYEAVEKAKVLGMTDASRAEEIESGKGAV